MTNRAMLFGSVASAYERYRLGYPDEVVDEVIAYAPRPLRNALEIGAGTGKATRLFAQHGIAVTATEPDDAMLSELRQHVPASVATMQGTLEELTPARTYDLVYAAAALHWTQPEQRWVRIAALLAPRGVFASFGGPCRLADPDLAKVVDEARAPWLTADDIAPPDGTPVGSPMQWPGTELERSELFTDVRQTRIERRLALTSADFVGYLSTVSAYLQLSEQDRRDVLSRVRAVLPPTVALVADIEMHLAHLQA